MSHHNIVRFYLRLLKIPQRKNVQNKYYKNPRKDLKMEQIQVNAIEKIRVRAGKRLLSWQWPIIMLFWLFVTKN
jgi:hypothetical protein